MPFNPMGYLKDPEYAKWLVERFNKGAESGRKEVLPPAPAPRVTGPGFYGAQPGVGVGPSLPRPTSPQAQGPTATRYPTPTPTSTGNQIPLMAFGTAASQWLKQQQEAVEPAYTPSPGQGVPERIGRSLASAGLGLVQNAASGLAALTSYVPSTTIDWKPGASEEEKYIDVIGYQTKDYQWKPGNPEDDPNALKNVWGTYNVETRRQVNPKWGTTRAVTLEEQSAQRNKNPLMQIGAWASHKAGEIEPNPYPLQEVGLKAVADPDFWVSGAPALIPATIGLLLTAVGVAKGLKVGGPAVASQIERELGLAPGMGQKIVNTIPPATMTITEAIMESGQAYEQAVTSGKTEAEAKQASQVVLAGNLALLEIDRLRWGRLLKNMPGFQKALVTDAVGSAYGESLGRKIIENAVVGIIGGPGEELAQSFLQDAAAHDPNLLKWTPQKEANVLGGTLMSVLFQGGPMVATNVLQALPRPTPPVQEETTPPAQPAQPQAPSVLYQQPPGSFLTPQEARPTFPGARPGEAVSAEDLLGGERQYDKQGNPILTREEQMAAGQADMFGGEERPTASPEPSPVAQPAPRRLTPQEVAAYRGQHMPYMVADLGIDPDRFQFRYEKDPITGESGSLKDIEGWETGFEGEFGVWADPQTGEVWLVDGHNRLAAAKRFGVKTLSVVEFFDADTADEAVAMGALRNMAFGNGTALDAANYLRKTGLTVDALRRAKVSLKKSMIRDGVALAKLNQGLFDKMRTGELPLERAVLIGEKIANPDLQVRLVQMIDAQAAKGKKITNDVVAELADMINAAPTERVTQETLFGTDTFTETYAIEKGELLAYITNRLSRDKRLFGMAAQHARELERGGNIIARETSLGISEEAGKLLGLFDVVKNRVGEVADAVNAGARRLAAGENPIKVKEETYAAVTESLPRVIAGAVAQRAAELQGVPGAAPEPAGAVAPVSATAAPTQPTEVAPEPVEPQAEVPAPVAEPATTQVATQPYTREQFQKDLTGVWGYSPKESRQLSAVFDGMAKAWSRWTGRASDEWYAAVIGQQRVGGTLDPAALKQLVQWQRFYSKLERVLAEKMPNRASAEMVRNLVRAGGVKPEETRWTGFDEWIDAQKNRLLTKEEVLQTVQAGRVEVREILKQPVTTLRWLKGTGETWSNAEEANIPRHAYSIDRLPNGRYLLRDHGSGLEQLFKTLGEAQGEAVLSAQRRSQAEPVTQYSAWVLPGGGTYRELLMTLPIGTRRIYGPSEAVIARHRVRWDELTGSINDARQGQDAAARRGDSASQDRFGRVLERLQEDREVLAAQMHRETVEEQSRIPSGPSFGPYQDPHWDEPNTLFHVRFSERTTPDGKRVLLIEEIQSGWHQEGREHGYKQELPPGFDLQIANARGRLNDALKVDDLLGFETVYAARSALVENPDYATRWQLAPETLKAAQEYIPLQRARVQAASGIPAAPFSKTWPDLAFKRMLAWAVENGFDSVAWTTGAQQTGRYESGLRKQVDRIAWNKANDGTIQIQAYKQGAMIIGGLFDPSGTGEVGGKSVTLEDTIGKQMASQIRRSMEQRGEFTGENLTIGGEGMKGFYDIMLPEMVNKYVKKWGGRVGETRIVTDQSTILSVRPVADLPGNLYELVDQRGQPYGVYKTEAAALAAIAPEHKGAPVHSLDLTPAMREALTKEGQPLFQRHDELAKGATQFLDDGRAILIALANPDVSTVLHEMVHVARRYLPAADIAVLEKHLGVKNGVWEERHDETLARMGERYFAEGKAPEDASPEMVTALDHIKQWMLSIYHAITGTDIDVPMTADVRRVFDRMIGSEMPLIQEQAAVTEPAPAQAVTQPAAPTPVTTTGYTRERFRKDLIDIWRLKPEQADAVGAITDARARAWAKATGSTPEQWYVSNIARIERTKAPIPDVKGAIEPAAFTDQTVKDARVIIRVFDGGNLSTIVHELGHIFQSDLSDADLAIAENWLGVKNHNWTLDNREDFANGFVRYLADGKSPTPGLATVFERFKSWLLEIYRGIIASDIDLNVSPEVRRIFDRLLGSELPLIQEQVPLLPPTQAPATVAPAATIQRELGVPGVEAMRVQTPAGMFAFGMKALQDGDLAQASRAAALLEQAGRVDEARQLRAAIQAAPKPAAPTPISVQPVTQPVTPPAQPVPARTPPAQVPQAPGVAPTQVVPTAPVTGVQPALIPTEPPQQGVTPTMIPPEQRPGGPGVVPPRKTEERAKRGEAYERIYGSAPEIERREREAGLVADLDDIMAEYKARPQQSLTPNTHYQRAPGPTELELLRESTTKAEIPFMQKVREDGGRFRRATLESIYDLGPLETKTGVEVHKIASVVPGMRVAGDQNARIFDEEVTDKVGKDAKNFQDYVVAMREGDALVIEPAAKLAGGVTYPARAINQMRAELGNARMKTIEDAANSGWTLDDDLIIQRRVDAGLLAPEGAAEMRARWPHYIPFQRQDFAFDDLPYHTGITRRADYTESLLKSMKLEGSQRKLEEPLAKWRQQFIQSELDIARNDAALSIMVGLGRLQRATGDHLIDFGVTEETTTRGVIHARVRGKPVVAQVPKEFADMAKGLEAEVVGFWSRLALWTSMPLRVGAVTWNAAFVLVNLARDTLDAWFLEGVHPGRQSYWRALFAAVTKNADYDEAARSGVFMSGFTETMTRIGDFDPARGVGGIKVRNLKDAMLLVFHGIARANEITEHTTRIATYLLKRSQGFSTLQSAYAARNATVDFARAGNVIKVINQAIPFLNAGIQGTANTVRMIRYNPGKAALRATPLVAVTVLANIANSMWESSKEIPDYEFMYNWVFQYGEYDGPEDPEHPDAPRKRLPLYVKIPKGPRAALITAPAEIGLRLYRHTDNRGVMETLLSAATNMGRAMLPIDPNVGSVAPPVMGTLYELATNYDVFRGMPIVPLGEQARPKPEQFGPNTSAEAVAIGQAFNVSPRYVDFAIQDATGGTGYNVSWVLDMALRSLGYDPEAPGAAKRPATTSQEGLTRIPIVSRFIGSKGTQTERIGYENLVQATEEARNLLYQNPEWRRFAIGVNPVGNTVTIDGQPRTLTGDQRADLQARVARMQKAAIDELIASSIYKSARTDPEKRDLIDSVLSRVQGNVRGEFIDEITGTETTRPYTEAELPDLVKALGVYQQYRAMPTYVGLPKGKEEQYTRLINSAVTYVAQVRRRYPTDMKNATELAKRVAMKERPDLARGIQLFSWAAKHRNKARSRFWTQNAALLERYYGSTVPVQKVA